MGALARRPRRHRAGEPGLALSPAAGSHTAPRALLERLIDHAALFPPAQMGMDDALAEDRAARSAEQSWMIGRFVCRASQLEALREAAGGWEQAPPLSVVLDGVTPTDEVSWTEAVRADAAVVRAARDDGAPVEALELPLPSPRPGSAALLAAQSAMLTLRVEKYLELMPGERWRDTLPAAIGATAAVGARVKLRCGGATAESFPSIEQVALVIAASRRAGVVFKATAGLHHPLRHVDAETGLPMHGFLNLLAAAAFSAAHGSTAGTLERVLAQEDPAAFTVSERGLEAEGLRASTEQIAAARHYLFTGYGSCSWREPVEDLQRLGMLA